MNINESCCQPYGMASALIVIGVSAWYPDRGKEFMVVSGLAIGANQCLLQYSKNSLLRLSILMQKGWDMKTLFRIQFLLMISYLRLLNPTVDGQFLLEMKQGLTHTPLLSTNNSYDPKLGPTQVNNYKWGCETLKSSQWQLMVFYSLLVTLITPSGSGNPLFYRVQSERR